MNNENDISKIKLPNTRFQGSKKKIIDKIYNFMFEHIKPKHILDLFGGSAICSLYFQLNNLEVTFNDILKFSSINANGFLQNDVDDIPTETEINNIFLKKENVIYDTFIQDNFKDIYYTDEENIQLDVFRKNIKMIENHNKKNIMYYLLFQSLISKRPYNLFHRKNLSMRLSEVKRGFGNKVTWEKTFINHMLKFRLEIIKLYEMKKMLKVTNNINIINNSYDEISSSIISQIDTLYIDPPYFKKDCKDSQYFDNYHFLEGFISDDWATKIDYSSNHLKLKTPQKHIIENADSMFDNIIKKYGDRNLIISYNTKAFPSIETIETKLKKKYKKVIVKYIDYNYVLSKKTSQEVVILALIF